MVAGNNAMVGALGRCSLGCDVHDDGQQKGPTHEQHRLKRK
jgi:hypothetical protein